MVEVLKLLTVLGDNSPVNTNNTQSPAAQIRGKILTPPGPSGITKASQSLVYREYHLPYRARSPPYSVLGDGCITLQTPEGYYTSISASTGSDGAKLSEISICRKDTRECSSGEVAAVLDFLANPGIHDFTVCITPYDRQASFSYYVIVSIYLPKTGFEQIQQLESDQTTICLPAIGKAALASVYMRVWVSDHNGKSIPALLSICGTGPKNNCKSGSGLTELYKYDDGLRHEIDATLQQACATIPRPFSGAMFHFSVVPIDHN